MLLVFGVLIILLLSTFIVNLYFKKQIKAEKLLAAKQHYQQTCALCHGVSGEGKDEVPSLNGSGHAWHHTDQQVAKWIREGIGKMPAVAPHWSDQTIEDVHHYIKLWWSEEQRQWQANATKQAQQ